MNIKHTQEIIREELDSLFDDIRLGRVTPHHKESVVAIFRAKQLDGGEHIGWHYAPMMTQPGERFHYDHGIGIDKNQDGQYLWVAPMTQKQIMEIIGRADDIGNLDVEGLITYDDGRQEWGCIQIDKTWRNRPASLFLNKTLVEDKKTFKQVKAISLMPNENLPVWEPTHNKPKDGQKIISWDNGVVRERSSLPHWNIGVFDASGKSNSRYQGYHGPMASGLPWASLKSYQTLDKLFEYVKHEQVLEAMKASKVKRSKPGPT